MARSTRWRRNQRLKCGCGGYWFPHRVGGGACDRSKTAPIHLARRTGDKNAVLDALIDYALAGNTPHQWKKGCPF